MRNVTKNMLSKEQILFGFTLKIAMKSNSTDNGTLDKLYDIWKNMIYHRIDELNLFAENVKFDNNLLEEYDKNTENLLNDLDEKDLSEF